MDEDGSPILIFELKNQKKGKIFLVDEIGLWWSIEKNPVKMASNSAAVNQTKTMMGNEGGGGGGAGGGAFPGGKAWFGGGGGEVTGAGGSIMFVDTYRLLPTKQVSCAHVSGQDDLICVYALHTGIFIRGELHVIVFPSDVRNPKMSHVRSLHAFLVDVDDGMVEDSENVDMIQER